MNHNAGKRVTRFIALAIFFVLLAGAFYVTAGKGLRSMVSMKLQMGVEQGAQLQDYSRQDARPRE